MYNNSNLRGKKIKENLALIYKNVQVLFVIKAIKNLINRKNEYAHY